MTPSLAQPVSQACLDAIRSPDRTFLGKRQLARFLRDVRRSTARFKVIMNEMPIQQYYVLPYDRWEGFEAERQQLLRELQSVKNVIFLTTDVHATLVNDARFQTLESGGPENSGILDVIVGPVATANFALEIDQTHRAAGQRRARGQRVLHAPAAGRHRDAVLGARPVQLRTGEGHEQPAHDHAQGHRRQVQQDGGASVHGRPQLPALTVKLPIAVAAALAALLVAAPRRARARCRRASSA